MVDKICSELNSVDSECNIQDLQSDIIKYFADKLNTDLELIARHKSIPSIKGEITKGKCKWRGLKICKQIDGLNQYYWIEQRGKLIGKKITVGNIL